MRIFTWLLVIWSLLGESKALGEACSNSIAPLTLISQAEVDALGATGCTRTHGGLSISGEDITNVDALRNITSVGSALTIFWNPLLTNLDGLSNLTRIGSGELRIEKNASLISTSGLANLEGDARSDGLIYGLVIQDNPQLQKIDGLSQITKLGGQLIIADNPVLTDLSGLENLEMVRGKIKIWRNDSLSNLDDMSNLARAGSVWIERNSSLENIDLLGQLDGVRYVQISQNPALQDLDGALTLNRSGAALGSSIYENESLADCRGLARLVGWPSGLPSRHAKDIFLNSNKLGCNSLEEVLDSVDGPSQPIIESVAVNSSQLFLEFQHFSRGDAMFPLSGYEASCLSASVSVVDKPELMSLRDNETISRALLVKGFAPRDDAPVRVEIVVDLHHEDLDELEISITSPEGTVLTLWDKAVTEDTELVGMYPTTLTPVTSFTTLEGEDLNGEWVLSVSDTVSKYGTYDGRLFHWEVRLTQGVRASVISSPAELNGLSRGVEYECVVAPLSELGNVPESEPFIVNPSAATMFNQLLDTVLSTTRGSGKNSSVDKNGARPAQGREGENDDANAIPTLNTFALFMLSGLISLFGIRRFTQQ